MHWDDMTAGGAWLVSRYADVSSALRDPRLSADRSFAYRLFLPPDADAQRLGDTIAGFLVFKDPPEHTRLRALVNKAFTPRALESLRSRIEGLVDSMLDRAVHDGKLQLIRDFAYPLPVTVISDMLGVPREDTDMLKPWVDDLAMFFGVIKGMKRAIASARRIEAYMNDLIAERRARPRDDMLTALTTVEVDGERLTDTEVFRIVSFLFLAGHHTTMNLIGNGTLALLRHPAEIERLRAEPSMVVTGVEEMLRYDSPVQAVGRVAKEDLEIGGVKIESGKLVLLMVAGANRDAAQFSEPDRFDVGRTPNRHVSFAGGAHFCVGAPLSRLEARIVFEKLLARFRRIELEGPADWIPNVNLRGVKELTLRVS